MVKLNELQEDIADVESMVHASHDKEEKERYKRLACYLRELDLRRSHTPLRCRLGLHKTVTGMGMLGPPFILTCVCCGKSWYAM